MSNLSLLLASVLVFVPVLISSKEKLGLEKEIVISVTRAIVQLFIVGYLLDIIFGLNTPIAILLLVIVMIINASFNIKKRGGKIEKVVAISFVAMLIGSCSTLSVLILTKAIDFNANEVIPISGMVISNSMVAIGLSYKNLNNSFESRRLEVETKLSLGAEIKDASNELIIESIKMSILPTIDSAKTLGIVSLPGMMTGLILAGTPPLIAIKFQILVTFMLLSATSISSMIATYLAYKSFFNDRKQLKY